jgi:putative sigma-54 modulation protein
MKLSYTGKQEVLTPAQQRKVDARVGKLSKFLLERGGRGEKEAKVVLTVQRHLKKAEVSVNFFDHSLIAESSASDQFTAILEALDKLEKQAQRVRERWRDTRRTGEGDLDKAAPKAKLAKPAAPKAKPARSARPARANGKPMTAEEAVLALEAEQDYLVYKDADNDRTSVVIRRRDGKLDIIQP